MYFRGGGLTEYTCDGHTKSFGGRFGVAGVLPGERADTQRASEEDSVLLVFLQPSRSLVRLEMRDLEAYKAPCWLPERTLEADTQRTSEEDSVLLVFLQPARSLVRLKSISRRTKLRAGCRNGHLRRTHKELQGKIWCCGCASVAYLVASGSRTFS